MPPWILVPAILLSLCFLTGSRVGAESELQILLDLKKSLGITKGFESWAPDNQPCKFTGISCENGSVAEIDLTGRGISGTLSFDSLCRLPFLSKLSLGSNNLSGDLTAGVRNCTALRHLDLAFNSLAGSVPDLSPLTQLRILNLSDNAFSGAFPWSSLGKLTALAALNVGDNRFDPGPFPEVVGSLSSIYVLCLYDCNLRGRIPPSIGNLTELIDLELSDNFLSGEIPPEITKLSKLQQLELYNNSLTGEIPPGFRNLTYLAFFDASENQLEGDLSELRFLTNLISLQLFANGFSGEVPPEFGEFKYLVNLSLYSNRLSGELPNRLGSWSEFNFIDVSTNSFSGTIPPDMCRMGKMKKLLILGNKFSGEIPATYGNCSSLLRFRVSNNSLSGSVPARIWSLPNVNIIDLAMNQLEGPVTADIGEAKSLYQLLIADNRFSGELPPEITEASSLVSMDATSNQLSGQIPASIGGLKNLVSLDLGKNEFSGGIPDSLGSCAALNAVNLAGNTLSGPIPASLGKLPSLNSLDLSDNQLSGEIPASLSSLKLSDLDLSNNLLTGQVPPALSIAAYSDSFNGNPGLCGENIGFLRRCSSAAGGSPQTLRTVLTCFLAGFAGLLASFGLIIFLKRRQQSDDGGIRQMSKNSWNLKSFRILTFDEQEIIDSIKRENLIGKGGSGNVYRVELESGKMLAVKHIWNSPDAASVCAGDGWSGGRSTAAMLTRRSPPVSSKEFEAEVATLSAIRHVNVVQLYCSITSEDSSLLVYEHLPNGSLWDRLHGPAAEKLGLDWEARYEVAVGAARGLEYLHHGCDRPIVHRDVKSSNILLDEWFKPRIADFGLAKILHLTTASTDHSTHVIAGTHGYIAPEYAYTWRINEKSDVYSFGVVLMELVTGRPPIEAEYGENKDIVDWVSGRMTSRECVMGVLDRRIRAGAREEAVRVLRVGVLCVARLPTMRPSMRTVVQMLEEAGGGRVVAGGGRKDQKAEAGGGYKVEARESFEKVKQTP